MRFIKLIECDISGAVSKSVLINLNHTESIEPIGNASGSFKGSLFCMISGKRIIVTENFDAILQHINT